MPVQLRRSQEERSAETRARLLAATVECLVERGYSGTTTTVIAERAGVSRGAQLHHFPTKAELVLAAVEHLAAQLDAELREAAGRLPEGGGDRVAVAIDLLWAQFRSPFFVAWLELWVAARTDAELRVRIRAAERRVHQGIERRTAAIFGPDTASRPDFPVAVRMTLALMNGLALARLLDARRSGSPAEREVLTTVRDLWLRTLA